MKNRFKNQIEKLQEFFLRKWVNMTLEWALMACSFHWCLFGLDPERKETRYKYDFMFAFIAAAGLLLLEDSLPYPSEPSEKAFNPWPQSHREDHGPNDGGFYGKWGRRIGQCYRIGNRWARAKWQNALHFNAKWKRIGIERIRHLGSNWHFHFHLKGTDSKIANCKSENQPKSKLSALE
jgi:hypothetical protein